MLSMYITAIIHIMRLITYCYLSSSLIWTQQNVNDSMITVNMNVDIIRNLRFRLFSFYYVSLSSKHGSENFCQS